MKSTFSFLLKVLMSTLRTRVCWLLYTEQLPHKMKYVPILKHRGRWTFLRTWPPDSNFSLLSSFEFCVFPQRAVKLLLKHRAEVNARDKFWHTPLHMAAAKWATGCALALIPHVCSLDVADRSGRTPLHHAAYSGHGEVNCKVDSLT